MKPRTSIENGIRIDLKYTYANIRNRIDSAQDRDCWRTLVNATLNLCIHKTWG